MAEIRTPNLPLIAARELLGHDESGTLGRSPFNDLLQALLDAAGLGTNPSVDVLNRLVVLEQITRQGRALFAPRPMVVDGTTLLIPGLTVVVPTRSPIFTRIDPANSARFWEQPISTNADERRHYVDDDTIQAGAPQAAVKYATGTEAPLFGSSRQILIATSVNGIVTPAPGLALISAETGGVGRNLIDFGTFVDQAPFLERSAAAENVADPTLNSLGFSRMVFDRINGRPFVTMPIQPARQSERLAIRFLVQTDTDNNWFTPCAYLLDTYGAVLSQINLEFETVVSPRLARFFYEGPFTQTTAAFVSFGVENSGGHPSVGTTGFQFAAGPGVRWIARADYPNPGRVGLEPKLASVRRALARQALLLPPKVVIDGDSIINQGTTAATSNGGFIATAAIGEVEAALCMDRRVGYESWLDASRPLGFDGANAARSGDTSVDVLNGLDDALAMGPALYACAVGVNDLNNNFSVYTLDYMKARQQEIADRVRRAGAKYMVATIRAIGANLLDPSIGPHAARRKDRVDLNDWIRNTLAAQPNVTLVDLARGYEDTSQPTSVSGDFLPKPGSLRDGTHPTPFGAWTCGAPVWLAAFQRLIPKFRACMPVDVDNLMDSAPFVGIRGLFGSRATGILPTGVRVGMGSGSSTVVAVQQNADTDTLQIEPAARKVALAINPAGNAAFEQIFIDQPFVIDVARYRGQYVRFWADAEAQAWPAWGNICLYVNDQTGATRMAANAAYDVSSDRMPTTRTPLLLRTPPFLVPADGSVRFLGPTLRITFFPTAAGGAPGYFDLRNWGLHPEPDPKPIYNRLPF